MDVAEPLQIFQDLLDQAAAAGVPEPTAMSLATVGPDNHPSVRIMLLKGVDDRGFLFFTNYESRKGRELLANRNAALCFFWLPIGKQVRVEGAVEPLSDAEADDYFATRPRGSQIGAWASKQSSPLANRDELLARVAELEMQYDGIEVPRPPYWSGFRLLPTRIEFWTAGEYRLHDRVIYEITEDDSWRQYALYP